MTTQTRPSYFRRFSAFKAIILCLLAGLFSTAFAEDWDGSTSKPSSREIDGVEYYVITSPSELAWFAYQVNEKGESKINAILGNDIHFMDNDSLTSKIASSTIGVSNSNIYDGVFDGAGYIIYGLYSKGAIFGYTGENFVLKNFSVKKSDIVTWVALNHGLIENSIEGNDGAKQVAGFAYTNYGTIKNCFAKNFGIAYTNRGLIENCNSKGTIGAFYSSYYSGGAFNKIEQSADRAGIAISNYGKIKNCSFEPINKVIVTNGYFGGISVYSGKNSIIENCLFKGKVKLQNTKSSPIHMVFGGIVASTSENTQIINSIVFIESLIVNGVGDGNIGGIVGDMDGYTSESIDLGGIISGSYANIQIDSLVSPNNSETYYNIYVGGIAGETNICDLNNSRSILTMEEGLYIESSNFLFVSSLVASIQGASYNNSRISASYGVIKTKKNAKNHRYGGVAFEASYSRLNNVYYDITVSTPDTMHAVGKLDGNSTQTNVLGKTTAVMRSPAFVETLNTNAGLDDDSGIWQYCEGNYPILVSEGTCEEFYSKYGLSSSSQSSSSSEESSSSTPVESSSSEAESSSSEIEFSSSAPILSSSSEESSSSSVIASSSSDESSSSKAETSSSTKPESSSSSKANSSSSKGTDIAWNAMRPMFNLSVNGMTLTLSNTQGGVVRIFDALGHMVTAKPLASATTSITLQTPGNYIVRVNGISRSVTLK
jgi:hypothetical protein